MISFLRMITASFAKHRLQSGLLLAALLVELAYECFMPLSFKFIIDMAIVPQQYSMLLLILGLMVTLALSTVLIGLYRDRMFAGLGTRIIKEYYQTMHEHLQKLSADYFHRTSSGDIVSRFNNDLISVETFIMLIPYALLSVFGLVLNVIVLFVLQWQLALLAVIGLPLCLIGPKLFGKKALDANYALKEEQASISTTVQENAGAHTVIRAFGLQGLLVHRFNGKMNAYQTISARAYFSNFLIDRTTNMGTMLLNLMSICIGSVLAFYGTLSIGSLLAFSTILISLSYLVAALTWLAPQFLQGSVGMKRMAELLEEQPTVADMEQAGDLPPIQDSIAFREVTFAYGSGPASLDRVSLSIPRGSYTAFVGTSGSGKSTIINLLMRFYDPVQGEVLYDGIDIRRVNQQSLRAQIGIVFQESILFNISIRENIRLGKPDATDEEVINAAHAAEIHDFILNLPDGYDTEVGERGGRLSGGQRQRLAIARAIIRNPAILILDEATSALDPATEAAINATLRRISSDRTVVSVTHRLASAEHADCIYVLRQGKIAEQGTHHELLGISGLYSQSWQKQTGFELSADGIHAEVHANRLKQLPLFSQMEDELLEEMSHYFVTESYAKERIVMHEGDPGDKFFIIVRGKVEVMKRDEHGEKQKIAVLSDGDYFGEMALLHNIPRTATICTATPVMFITLQRDFFQALLRKAPHLKELMESRFK